MVFGIELGTYPENTMHAPNAISSRANNKLSDVKIKSFVKRAVAGQKLADGSGMYLQITPAKKKSAIWRIKYRFDGVERTYTIGAYPEFSLETARAERDEMKKVLREGRDPVQVRKVGRVAEVTSSGNTFAEIANAWLEKEKAGWSEIHYKKSKRAIEKDVFPLLGGLPIAGITPVMVTGAIKKIVKRGARDTASKVLQHVTGIFRYAQSEGLCGRENPAEPAQEALPKAKSGHYAALVTFPELGGVLRSAAHANLTRPVYMAHRLIAFTIARINNAVQAQWSELDLDADVPTWIIPRSKMKAHDRDHDHKIVLCPQIAAELRGWRAAGDGKGYLFPARDGGGKKATNGYVTREAIEKAYRVTLGLKDKHSPHSWRSSFSTLARDHDFERDVVELTLDHIHDNEVARAYDRGLRLQQRIKLMNWWGDQLSRAERGADVVKIKGA